MQITKELEIVPNKIEVKVNSIEDRYINVTTRDGMKLRLAQTKTLSHLEVGKIYTLKKIQYLSNDTARMIDPATKPNVTKFKFME